MGRPAAGQRITDPQKRSYLFVDWLMQTGWGREGRFRVLRAAYARRKLHSAHLLVLNLVRWQFRYLGPSDLAAGK